MQAFKYTRGLSGYYAPAIRSKGASVKFNFETHIPFPERLKYNAILSVFYTKSITEISEAV